MAKCPNCDAALTWRAKLSGFTVSQCDRGIINCQNCQTQLELTPGSGGVQVVIIGIVAVATLALVKTTPPTARTIVVLAVVCTTTLAALASYLWLSRFRVRQQPSILPPTARRPYSQ